LLASVAACVGEDGWLDGLIGAARIRVRLKLLLMWKPREVSMAVLALALEVFTSCMGEGGSVLRYWVLLLVDAKWDCTSEESNV
jgi:hypothetical protein